MNPFGFDRQTQLLVARLHAQELEADWRAANLRRGRDGEPQGWPRTVSRAGGRIVAGFGALIAARESARRRAAHRTGTGC